MIKFDNNFYDYSEKESILKFYADEFERLLLKYNILIDNIELNEDGDIYCYVNLNYNKLDCKRFTKILKDKVPLIQDIILKDGFFILTFNIKIIELF